MALRDVIPLIVRDIKDNKDVLKTNENLFDIYEGDLARHLKNKILQEFSGDTRFDVLTRVTPINILTRVVDKMAQIYTDGPTRRATINGDISDSDQELLDWYIEMIDIDNVMNASNEMFNFSNSSLLEPFVHDGMPHLRCIPSHQFWVYSTDKVYGTRPTHVATFSEDRTSLADKTKEPLDEFFFYSDEEFLIADQQGNADVQKMMALNNPGINPFGALPFVYINQSKYNLVPLPDIDMLKMSLIIPMLVTDLNYAVKYQAFSTTYTIDVDQGSLIKAPNALWDLTSKIPGEGAPQIGSIKPEVDIDQVLNLISSELSMWLNTKGIKTNAIDSMDSASFASGISKLIDEMDIIELRKKQVAIYHNAEKELWNLILKVMHPVWVRAGMVENTAMFSPNAEVEIDFTPPIPMVSRADIIAEVEQELSAGFTTKERALKRLNPRMTDDEIQSLLEEIMQEKEDNAQRFPIPAFETNEEDEAETEEVEE